MVKTAGAAGYQSLVKSKLDKDADQECMTKMLAFHFIRLVIHIVLNWRDTGLLGLIGRQIRRKAKTKALEK